MGPGGMIYVQSLMKMGIDIQAILRFFHRNMKGSNVGITESGD
jgi:hypothetical protein